MANWLGFDSAARASDPPGGLSTKKFGTSCVPNPSQNNLASYTKAHYANATPALKFFARYFYKSDGTSMYVPSTETSVLSSAQFNFLIPLTSPYDWREQTTGTAGFNYGVDDAHSTVNNLWSAIQAGGMGVNASTSRIYVYLDIEPNVALSQDYWNGFSQTIYNYLPGAISVNCPTAGTLNYSPFYACAYANPVVAGYPNRQQTMDVLSSAPPGSPNYPQNWCFGLWTQQASFSDCASCSLNPPPAWSNAAGYGVLTLHFWQHAINDACCGPAPDFPDCEQNCRPWVDDDQSTPEPSWEILFYVIQVC